MARPGRKSAAQTPAPKSERIYGSSRNPTGSASSQKSAKSIELSDKVIKSLEKKRDEYNSLHSKKVTLATLKAVYRRGAGAYSSSHRPTITGGRPNSRNAWAMARVNKFLLKKSGKKVKAAYVQDDDLMALGGVTSQIITCRRCSWSWDTKDSDEFDKYICHVCGFDNRTYYDVDPIGKYHLGEEMSKHLNKVGYMTQQYAKGGEIKHNMGAAGGYLVGKRHSQGGIKAMNKSTGQALEMEGGEVVITRDAVNDPTKREFNGKMMTNKEILSAINVSGGGVSFAEGGKVSECMCSGRRYKYGGKVLKDYEIIQEIKNQYPNQFNKGVQEEMSEHEVTFKLLIKRKLTPRQAAERVVAEHLQKKPNYYDNYEDGGYIDVMGRTILDYPSFMKGGMAVRSPYQGESEMYYKVYHPVKKTHMYAKGGNIRSALITPLLAYKNFLFLTYNVIFNELPNAIKNGLLQGKQNLVDNYVK